MANDVSNKMAQLIGKAMSDDKFKAQLFNDPVAVLKAEGLESPDGLEIKVLENTNKVFHLVLPQNTSELSDDELNEVAGGTIVGGGFLPPFLT